MCVHLHTYVCIIYTSVCTQSLKKWHSTRVECLLSEGVDVLAIETIPAQVCMYVYTLYVRVYVCMYVCTVYVQYVCSHVFCTVYIPVQMCTCVHMYCVHVYIPFMYVCCTCALYVYIHIPVLICMCVQVHTYIVWVYMCTLCTCVPVQVCTYYTYVHTYSTYLQCIGSIMVLQVEAEAIVDLLRDYPSASAWVCYSCKVGALVFCYYKVVSCSQPLFHITSK